MVTGIIDSTMSHGRVGNFCPHRALFRARHMTAWLLEAHFGMKGVDFAAEPSSDEFVDGRDVAIMLCLRALLQSSHGRY